MQKSIGEIFTAFDGRMFVGPGANNDCIDYETKYLMDLYESINRETLFFDKTLNIDTPFATSLWRADKHINAWIQCHTNPIIEEFIPKYSQMFANMAPALKESWKTRYVWIAKTCEQAEKIKRYVTFNNLTMRYRIPDECFDIIDTPIFLRFGDVTRDNAQYIKNAGFIINDVASLMSDISGFITAI